MAALAGGVIEATNTIEGTFQILRNVGVPTNGSNEIQTLTLGGTIAGGTFPLTLNGQGVGPILWNATNTTLLGNIQAALDAVFGASQIVATAGALSAGIGTALLTFSGVNWAVKNAGSAFVTSAASLIGTSPTAAVTRTTPGVTASFRGASAGQLLADITNDLLYQNQGVPGAPLWNKVGPQT